MYAAAVALVITALIAWTLFVANMLHNVTVLIVAGCMSLASYFVYRQHLRSYSRYKIINTDTVATRQRQSGKTFEKNITATSVKDYQTSYRPFFKYLGLVDLIIITKSGWAVNISGLDQQQFLDISSVLKLKDPVCV